MLFIVFIKLFVLSVIFVTFLSILFGELIPKRIGLLKAERIARIVARPMKVFSRVGYPVVVKAQVLAIDLEKRQIRLGMKQLAPTGLDEYIAEHKEGDVVTGRLMDEASGQARVELGEGIHATCKMAADSAPKKDAAPKESKADISSLSSMLQARWKSGSGGSAKTEPVRTGQVRSFRIVSVDRAAKKIGLEFA